MVCATNRNFAQEVEAGRFRQDLFYRINVVRITLPPLRDRLSDLPVLVDYFFSSTVSDTDCHFGPYHRQRWRC